MIMRVYQIHGEPTRFMCESTSLECPSCKKLFTRLEARNADLKIGSRCPACHQSDLDVRFHLVDVAAFAPVGQCTCEHFQFRLKSALSKLSPVDRVCLSQGEAKRLRCSHIEAARHHALDLTINQYEKGRLVNAGRQTEEGQP